MNELWSFTTSSPAFALTGSPRCVAYAPHALISSSEDRLLEAQRRRVEFYIRGLRSKTGFDGRANSMLEVQVWRVGDLLDYTGPEPTRMSSSQFRAGRD